MIDILRGDDAAAAAEVITKLIIGYIRCFLHAGFRRCNGLVASA